MGRRPQQYDQEQDHRLEPDASRYCRPTNHWGEGTRSTADDNVLWRPPLQPHRVDDDIEEDRKGEQRGGFDIERKSKDGHGAAGNDKSEYKRLVARDLPTGNWTPGGADHHSVDVSVTPHIENTGGASSCRDGTNCNGRKQRVEVTGRNRQPNKRREHRKRHHTRLHECNETRQARCETYPQRNLRGLKETRMIIEQKRH